MLTWNESQYFNKQQSPRRTSSLERLGLEKIPSSVPFYRSNQEHYGWNLNIFFKKKIENTSPFILLLHLVIVWTGMKSWTCGWFRNSLAGLREPRRTRKAPPTGQSDTFICSGCFVLATSHFTGVHLAAHRFNISRLNKNILNDNQRLNLQTNIKQVG